MIKRERKAIFSKNKAYQQGVILAYKSHFQAKTER
jgi:hypothetical protein